MNHYIGVDPGMTGAVAIIGPNNVDVFDFENRAALLALHDLVLKDGDAFAFVEKVGVMPRQGISTSGKFMRATGIAVGWLEALAIPFEEISPTKWQRRVFDSGARTGDNKKDSLNLARKLFPSMMMRLKRKKDHNRADALLIAEACRRAREVLK